MLTPFYEIIAFLLFILIIAAVVVLSIYAYMLIIEFTDLLINKMDRAWENHRQFIKERKEREIEEGKMGDIIENQFNNSRRKRSP